MFAIRRPEDMIWYHIGIMEVDGSDTFGKSIITIHIKQEIEKICCPEVDCQVEIAPTLQFIRHFRISLSFRQLRF